MMSYTPCLDALSPQKACLTQILSWGIVLLTLCSHDDDLPPASRSPLIVIDACFSAARKMPHPYVWMCHWGLDPWGHCDSVNLASPVAHLLLSGHLVSDSLLSPLVYKDLGHEPRNPDSLEHNLDDGTVPKRQSASPSRGNRPRAILPYGPEHDDHLPLRSSTPPDASGLVTFVHVGHAATPPYCPH